MFVLGWFEVNVVIDKAMAGQSRRNHGRRGQLPRMAEEKAHSDGLDGNRELRAG